jgi:hypothetical protein
MQATGGGAQFTTPHVGESIVYSRPNTFAGHATAWQAGARAVGPESGPLTVYVVCFRRVGVRRGAVMSRGRRTDVVLIDAVPQDFGASVLR